MEGMKEYIEKAAVEKFIEDGLNNPDKNKAFGHDAIEIMAEVHYMQAADVVEVTFCKDCRYYQDAKVNEKGFLICPASGMEITETDFCSYGQRKIETVLPKSDAKDESLEADHETPQN